MASWWRVCWGTVLMVMLCACSGQGADEAPGLDPGAKAPAFTLPDQHGKQRRLAELLEKRKVALVFYRSAEW